MQTFHWHIIKKLIMKSISPHQLISFFASNWQISIQGMLFSCFGPCTLPASSASRFASSPTENDDDLVMLNLVHDKKCLGRPTASRIRSIWSKGSHSWRECCFHPPELSSDPPPPPEKTLRKGNMATAVLAPLSLSLMTVLFCTLGGSLLLLTLL